MGRFLHILRARYYRAARFTCIRLYCVIFYFRKKSTRFYRVFPIVSRTQVGIIFFVYPYRTQFFIINDIRNIASIVDILLDPTNESMFFF